MDTDEAFAASLAQAPAIVRPRLETLRDAYQQGYDETTACWPAIATRIESTKADAGYAWMPTIRSFAPPVQVVENKSYQHAVRVPVEHLFSGEIAEYLAPLRRAGASAKRLPDQLLAALIVENPLGFDGVPFFGAGHPVEAGNENSARYSNVHASACDVTVAMATTLAGLMEVRTAEVGLTIGSVVTALLVPPALAGDADRAARFCGLAVAVLPDLQADHPYWYILARVGDTLPFIWQERTPAAFMIFDQRDWACHMGPIARGAVATTHPFLACRVRA